MVIDGTEIGIFPRQHGEIEDLRLLFLPIHIFQLVRCGPEEPRAPEVIRIPSGPLVGGLELEDTDQRTDRRSGAGAAGDGGDEETRTPDPLLAKEMLCQLSYVPATPSGEVVGVSGLEPETSALSGQCSNQLS